MIEEMQQQEAAFLKEENEKKLKNRISASLGWYLHVAMRLTAFLPVFPVNMATLALLELDSASPKVRHWAGSSGEEYQIGWVPSTVPCSASLAQRFGLAASGLTSLVWDEARLRTGREVR